MSNDEAGISIDDGSSGNELTYNTIGLNRFGIVISDSDDTLVRRNSIGRYLLATIPNTSNGILISGDSQGTQVLENEVAHNGGGGVLVNTYVPSNTLIEGNEIYKNTAAGIGLTGSTSGNTVSNNLIYSNDVGIVLLDTAFGNTIETGTINNNTHEGIYEAATAGPNNWTHLSLYDNGGLGIDRLGNGLSDTPYPVITSVLSNGDGSYTVTGTAGLLTQVELYLSAPDPSGYGEGRLWIGSDTTNYSGVWQILSPVGGAFTALQRVYASSWIASEFGPTTWGTYLPLVTR
jgi:parallel beta-helix repeat protein